MTNSQETDIRRRHLALDIADGKVFGSWQCEGDEVVTVFMALAFLQGEQWERLRKEAAQVYQYLSEAGPTGVNGKPVFMSMHLLTHDDWAVVAPLVTKLLEERARFVKGGDTC